MENKQKSEQEFSTETKRLLIYILLKLGLLCAILTVLFTLVFGIFINSGETMYPRLRDGDITIYYRLEREYQLGDVVVYQAGQKLAAARVAARAGDVVELNEQGQLLVNGNIQEEEIFFPTEPIAGGISYPYEIPKGQYFLLGDQRPASSDSRFYGAVDKKEIKGKIINLFRRRGI